MDRINNVLGFFPTLHFLFITLYLIYFDFYIIWYVIHLILHVSLYVNGVCTWVPCVVCVRTWQARVCGCVVSVCVHVR
jgi:hypothetical protein